MTISPSRLLSFGQLGDVPDFSLLISDTDVLNWISFAPVTLDYEKVAYNSFVLTLKAYGIYSILGYMNYVSPSSYSAAKKDCVGLTTGTEGGGMTSSDYIQTGGASFVPAAGNFLKTGLYPNTFPKFSSTSAMMYAWCGTISGGGCAIGSSTSGLSEASLIAGVGA